MTQSLIALVTATIHDLIGTALADCVAGAAVRIGTPAADMSEDAQATLCLHRLSALPHLRNDDLPTRQSDGRVARPPTAAIALHYFLSFDARDALSAQVMLGSVLAVLHAVPRLTEDRFARVLRQDGRNPALKGIAPEGPWQPVGLVCEYPGENELWTLWSAFRAAPRPSLHFVASPVLIEAEIPAEPAKIVSSIGISLVTDDPEYRSRLSRS